MKKNALRLAATVAICSLFMTAACAKKTTTAPATPSTSSAAASTSVSSSQAATSKGPQTYQMGQPVQVKNSSGQYTETVSQAHYTTSGGNQITTPQHGGFLVATVDISVTSGNIPFNPLYYTLVAPDGSRWDADATGGGFTPALSSGQLAAGEKTHGYIAFDAPISATASGAKIAATDPLQNVIAYWAL